MQNNIDWKKYLIVFLFTIGLFLLASYLSNYFSGRKIAELQSIQNKIAIDVLSSETQFSLLQDLSCKNVNDSFLSGELGELSKKLEWGQANLGETDEVLYLRKYYSLLQIKDYLLMKKISERCGHKYAFVLYFYTTEENCSECSKQSIVLSNLREKYPNLRVYSFDYSTDLSAVRSMLSIYKIEDTKLPALVVDEKVLTGYTEPEALEKLLKDTFKLEEPKVEDGNETKN